MATRYLAPVRDCRHCGAQFPTERRRGRPPMYCAPSCRTAAQRAYKRAYARGDVTPSVPAYVDSGVPRHGSVVCREEAEAIAQGPLWEAFVPEPWSTYSRDDHPEVEPGLDVGMTTPGLGRVIGSYRPWYAA